MCHNPIVGKDLAYSYGPAIETGSGLLEVNSKFRDLYDTKLGFLNVPLVPTQVTYTVLPLKQDMAYLMLASIFTPLLSLLTFDVDYTILLAN